jgi:NAD(P)-dependent dehydrogenase (short-subunit alcohol dehydrogenase family)
MHPSLFSQFDLTGKAAIVTGASRGLGVSFARGLAKAGCDLIVAARDLDQLREVALDLEQYGRRVVPVQADIRHQQDVESLVQRSVAEFGKVDILINNAGISAVAEAEAMTREQWQSVIDTNLTALFFCAQCAARQMLRQGSGKIINIASMYGISASSYVSQADARAGGRVGAARLAGGRAGSWIFPLRPDHLGF